MLPLRYAEQNNVDMWKPYKGEPTCHRQHVGKLKRECDKGNASIPPTGKVPNPTPYEDPFLKVCEVKIYTGSCPHVKVKIFDRELDALLDSGATVSVTSMENITNSLPAQL